MIEWLKRLFDKEYRFKNKVLALWKTHALLREGWENRVYKDSLGKPTVGFGHLVLPEDNLKVGDIIPDERIDAFFFKDSEEAYLKAVEQAKELGAYNVQFVVALLSVNYQLGDFKHVFGKTRTGTYMSIKNGNYEKAIQNLKKSLWYKQTPVRVNDLIKAIEKEFL